MIKIVLGYHEKIIDFMVIGQRIPEMIVAFGKNEAGEEGFLALFIARQFPWIFPNASAAFPRVISSSSFNASLSASIAVSDFISPSAHAAPCRT
jgi:hypothetical protein